MADDSTSQIVKDFEESLQRKIQYRDALVRQLASTQKEIDRYAKYAEQSRTSELAAVEERTRLAYLLSAAKQRLVISQVDVEIAVLMQLLHDLRHPPNSADTKQQAPTCMNCGVDMQRAGSCYACSNCGATSS